MTPARKVAVISLCTIGALKEFKVGDIFENEYLRSEHFNLTKDEIDFEVQPVSSYTYAGVTLLILLISDLVLYKAVISLGITSLITSLCFLTWGQGILFAKLSVFAETFGTSTDVAYFGYAFAVTEPELYPRVSGYSRASLLFGRLLAHSLGQILVLAFDIDFLVLNYISLVCVCLAFVFSLFILSASKSELHRVIDRELMTPGHLTLGREHSSSNGHLHNSHGDTITRKPAASISSIQSDFGSVGQDSPGLFCDPGPLFYDIDTSSLGFSYNDMMSETSDASSLERTQVGDSQQIDFKEELSIKEQLIISAKSLKETFSIRSVILWSVFWMITTLMNLQVGTKIDVFLDTFYPDRDAEKYDSTIETVSLLVGFLTVILASHLKIMWANFEVVFVTCSSVLLCVVLGLTCGLHNLWMSYTLYAALRVFYQIVITIAMFRVAHHVTGGRFALIFGVNMATAGLLDLILTSAAAATSDVQFPLVTQLSIVAGMLGLYGLLLTCLALGKFLCCRTGSVAEVRDDLDTLVSE